MRRSLFGALVLGALFTLAACTNDSSSAPTPASVSSLLDGTAPPPGNCVAGEELPTVTLVVDGKNITPTFGIGSSECATVTGNGYIAFDYDPAIVDTNSAIVVVVDGEADVKLAWTNGEPFTQTNPGRWRSSTPTKGCSRLTIDLVSPSGTSTETVGADIRVGGTTVPCPQRGLGPVDQIDTRGSGVTNSSDVANGSSNSSDTGVPTNTNP